MEKVKEAFRRLTFVCLFCFAIFSTYQAFSGITIVDWLKWIDERSLPLTITAKSSVTKDCVLQNKALPKETYDYRELSVPVIKNGATTLEEAIDWHKYPSEKVVATGYTAGFESTGKNPGHPGYGITYSGVPVRRDLYSTIAADPALYPIGSILYIPGYGYGVVADTGSAIKGNRIDLYYETVSDVYDHWGKKEVEVFVIRKGSGKLTEQEIIDLNEAEVVQVFRQSFLR